MGNFYSQQGNLEVWDNKPKGYYTEEEWTAKILAERTVEGVRAEKLAELSAAFITAQTTAHLTSSFGFTIDANDDANRNVSGLVTLMSAEGAPASLQFCDYNNQLRTVTLADLKVMQTEIIANGSALYAAKWAYRDAINGATTVEELDGITITFNGVSA